MSPVFARASPATATPRVRRAISLTAMRSPGEAAGKPASIMSTFSRTSCSATCIFSSVVIVAPGDCSPSRNVVSKIRITSGSSTSFFLLEIKKGVSVSNVILLTQQFLFSYLEHSARASSRAGRGQHARSGAEHCCGAWPGSWGDQPGFRVSSE